MVLSTTDWLDCRRGMSAEFVRRVSPHVTTAWESEETRTFLFEHTFPKLTTLFRLRGIDFNPDNWAEQVPRDRYKEGFLLPHILNSIHHESPFYIGVLGEKVSYDQDKPIGSFDEYCDKAIPSSISKFDFDTSGCRTTGRPTDKLSEGYLGESAGGEWDNWLETNISLAIAQGHDWVGNESFHNVSESTKSLSSLEIEQVCRIQEGSEFTCFYFRIPQILDDEELATRRHHNSFTPVVNSNDDVVKKEKLLMKELRARLGNMGFPVRYFRTLDELDSAVMEDWTTIATRLSVKLRSPNQPFLDFHDYIDQESSSSLIRYLSATFCRTPQSEVVLQALTEFTATFCNRTERNTDLPAGDLEFGRPPVLSLHKIGSPSLSQTPKYYSNHSILAVSGGPGCGKTSTIAHWLQDASAKFSENVVILSNLTASGHRSRDVLRYMHQCIRRLRRDTIGKWSGLANKADNKFEIQQMFHAAIASTPCLLVFDGLNEVSSACGLTFSEVKHLTWLPYPLPPTCRMIVTTTPADRTYTMLQTRHGTRFVLFDYLKTAEAKESIFNKHLSRSPVSRNISKHMRDGLWAMHASQNPSYLVALANEIKDGIVWTDLTSHIRLYANSDICEMTMYGCWALILRRWSRDYSWTVGGDSTEEAGDGTHWTKAKLVGWIPDALILLSCSKTGLTLSELLQALTLIGYTEEAKVHIYDWLRFRNAAAPIFHYGFGSLISLRQDVCEVVDYLLLGSVLPTRAEVIKVPIGMRLPGSVDKKEYHNILAGLLLGHAYEDHRPLEALWQLEMSGQKQILLEYLTHPRVFSRLYGSVFTHQMRSELFRYASLFPVRDVIELCKRNLITVDQNMAEGVVIGFPTADLLDESLVTKSSDLDGVLLGEEGLPENQCSSSRTRSMNATYFDSGRLSKANSLANKMGESSLEPETFFLTVEQLCVYGIRVAQFVMLTSQHNSKPTLYAQAMQNYLSKDISVLEDPRNGTLLCELEKMLGDACYRSRDYPHALYWYGKALGTVSMSEQVLELHTDTKGFALPFKVNLLLHLGRTSLELGNMGEAEDRLSDAYSHMDQQDDPEVFLYKLYMGRLRYAEVVFNTSEAMLMDACNGLEKWHGLLHPSVGEACHQLGVLLMNTKNSSKKEKQRNLKKAEWFLRKSAHIQINVDPESLDTAKCLFTLGYLLKNDRQLVLLKEALALFRRSQRIRATNLGSDHEDTRRALYAATDLASELQSVGARPSTKTSSSISLEAIIPRATHRKAHRPTSGGHTAQSVGSSSPVSTSADLHREKSKVLAIGDRRRSRLRSAATERSEKSRNDPGESLRQRQQQQPRQLTPYSDMTMHSAVLSELERKVLENDAQTILENADSAEKSVLMRCDSHLRLVATPTSSHSQSPSRLRSSPLSISRSRSMSAGSMRRAILETASKMNSSPVLELGQGNHENVNGFGDDSRIGEAMGDRDWVNQHTNDDGDDDDVHSTTLSIGDSCSYKKLSHKNTPSSIAPSDAAVSERYVNASSRGNSTRLRVSNNSSSLSISQTYSCTSGNHNSNASHRNRDGSNPGTRSGNNLGVTNHPLATLSKQKLSSESSATVFGPGSSIISVFQKSKYAENARLLFSPRSVKGVKSPKHHIPSRKASEFLNQLPAGDSRINRSLKAGIPVVRKASGRSQHRDNAFVQLVCDRLHHL